MTPGKKPPRKMKSAPGVPDKGTPTYGGLDNPMGSGRPNVTEKMSPVKSRNSEKGTLAAWPIQHSRRRDRGKGLREGSSLKGHNKNPESRAPKRVWPAQCCIRNDEIRPCGPSDDGFKTKGPEKKPLPVAVGTTQRSIKNDSKSTRMAHPMLESSPGPRGRNLLGR